MIEIELTEPEMNDCWTHAKEIVDYYDKRNGKGGSGAYGHNKVASNIVGVKVELAAAKWLKSQMPTAVVLEHFWDFKSNRASDGDIGVIIDNVENRNPIEAKGVTDEQWENVHPRYHLPLRRMVTPNQLKNYLKHDALILWGTASRDRVDHDVRIRGWNLASDLEEHGEAVRTICDNVSLRDDRLMRRMDLLPMFLAGVVKVA